VPPPPGRGLLNDQAAGRGGGATSLSLLVVEKNLPKAKKSRDDVAKTCDEISVFRQSPRRGGRL
jgi:hypothetical protein